jgi:hypothetical protein
VLFAAVLALVGGQSFADIPSWTELPQDMAVTGPSARSWALSLADPFVAVGDHAPWTEAAPPLDAPARAAETREPLPLAAAAIVGALLVLWMFVRRRRIGADA